MFNIFQIQNKNEVIRNLKSTIQTIEQESDLSNRKMINDAKKFESADAKNSEVNQTKLQQDIINLSQQLYSNTQNHRDEELQMRKVSEGPSKNGFSFFFFFKGVRLTLSPTSSHPTDFYGNQKWYGGWQRYLMGIMQTIYFRKIPHSHPYQHQHTHHHPGHVTNLLTTAVFKVFQQFD